MHPAADTPSSSLQAALRRVLVLVLALAALEGCAGGPTAPVAVKVLAINDFHGSLQTPPGGVPDARGGAPVRAGGAAHLATLVRQLQAQNPQHIFVAAGDLVGASPLLSALFHDEPTIEALSLMGLRLSAVGNHEFDQGAAELLRLQRGGCAADGCKGPQRFAGAGFQYLAASTVERASGRTLLPAYRVERFAGIPVGFIGLTLRATPSLVMPSGVEGLAFGDEVQTVNALVPQLRAQGVEAIVVLMHQGGVPSDEDSGDDGRDCSALTGPIVGIVRRLDPAIDVVVSGHTHRAYACRVGQRLLTSAGSHGRLLTEIDLELDARSGDVVRARARNHVVAVDVYAKDPQQTALIAAYERRAQALAQRVVARLGAALPRETNAAGESPLGQVIADAQLEATRAAGAQLALMNPGGIRAALPMHGDGRLRYEQLFAAQPFGNALVTLTLSGAQLLRLLEQQWHGQPRAAGRILHVSQGFSYTWDASRRPGQRVLADSLRLYGQTISATSTLRVTVNRFMAEGGDHFNVLRQGTQPSTGLQDIDALEAYLAAHPGLRPPEQARIQRLH